MRCSIRTRRCCTWTGRPGFLIDGVAFSGRAVDADPVDDRRRRESSRPARALVPAHRASAEPVDAPLHELREMDRLEGLPISRVVRCNFADTRGCLVQLGAWEHPRTCRSPSATRAWAGRAAQASRPAGADLEGCQFLQLVKGFPLDVEVSIRAKSDMEVLRAAQGAFYRDAVYFRATRTLQLRFSSLLVQWRRACGAAHLQQQGDGHGLLDPRRQAANAPKGHRCVVRAICRPWRG